MSFRVDLILLIAITIDYLIADPQNWPHPVQIMGWGITQLQKFILNCCHSPQGERPVFGLRLAGIILAAVIIFTSIITTWSLIWLTNQIHPFLGILMESILLASCFAGRSLRNAALDVLQPFKEENYEGARQRLSYYVGRDTLNLTPPEILRAILETVSENGVDGVMAPLFYSLIGAGISLLLLGSKNTQDITNWINPTFIIPLVIAYKASSTLDSMIGYREIPYTHIGWFSAKLEDCLTWIPCRLTVITLGVLSRHPLHLWQICQRDGKKDPSPNSGWSETAYATILGVQLGGINSYRGVIKEKPLLGDPIYPITPERIEKALGLTRTCFLIWVGLLLGRHLLSIMMTFLLTFRGN